MRPTRFVIDSNARAAAARAAIEFDPSAALVEVTIKPHKDDKTRDQEERYHAMLGDVAKQCQHLNRNLDLETWKRLAIDQFRRDTLEEPKCCADYWARNPVSFIPSLDGGAVIVLGEQSRRFPRSVAAVFIEWLFAFGAERDVIWSDPTQVPVEAYAEDRRAA